jgi:enamine deaminase RidA (YjgF/YER057c/UK114 family)
MQLKNNGTPRRAPRHAKGPAAPAAQHPAQWRQSFERYKALAEEAGRSADDVARENYYQHAEHYLRLIHEAGRD